MTKAERKFAKAGIVVGENVDKVVRSRAHIFMYICWKWIDTYRLWAGVHKYCYVHSPFYPAVLLGYTMQGYYRTVCMIFRLSMKYLMKLRKSGWLYLINCFQIENCLFYTYCTSTGFICWLVVGKISHFVKPGSANSRFFFFKILVFQFVPYYQIAPSIFKMKSPFLLLLLNLLVLLRYRLVMVWVDLFLFCFYG